VCRYHSLFVAAASRVSRRWGDQQAGEANDIVQEIYLRIYSDRDHILTGCRGATTPAIFAYLKVVAINAAHDYCRRRSARKRSSRNMVDLSEFPEAGGFEGDLHQRLVLSDVDRLLAQSTSGVNGPRDRAIFRLYYNHGMTAQAISDLPGVALSAKGVEGVLHRLTRTIRREMGKTQEISAD